MMKHNGLVFLCPHCGQSRPRNEFLFHIPGWRASRFSPNLYLHVGCTLVGLVVLLLLTAYVVIEA